MIKYRQKYHDKIYKILFFFYSKSFKKYTKKFKYAYTINIINIKERVIYMEIFNNDNYKYISNFVESKIPILRQNENFNKKYLEQSNLIDMLNKTLEGEQKEKFNTLIQSFYETEEYYFALSYSLGIKYGEDLKSL